MNVLTRSQLGRVGKQKDVCPPQINTFVRDTCIWYALHYGEIIGVRAK